MKLMTHIVAGYPTIKECEDIAIAMDKAGVAFMEVQFPFSDPIADGPTIQKANTHVLKNGMTTEKSFALIKSLKKKVKMPILIMTYYNIAFTYGLEKFIRRAASLGIYGFIIPDIPIDEEKYDHYLRLCKKYNLHAVQVISPITPDRRLKQIARTATGFVYCVSRLGTTGERKALNPSLTKYLKRVKKHIKIPLALGFGISTREQACAAAREADIIVMGSKILNLYNDTPGNKKVSTIKEFLSKMF